MRFTHTLYLSIILAVAAVATTATALAQDYVGFT